MEVKLGVPVTVAVLVAERDRLGVAVFVFVEDGNIERVPTADRVGVDVELILVAAVRVGVIRAVRVAVPELVPRADRVRDDVILTV